MGYYQFGSNVTIILKVKCKIPAMNEKANKVESCPIARSLTVAGDAWNLLILRDAHAGLTRFDQFRKNLGIAPTILTRRLQVLTEEGLLEKRRYMESPPREEYLLTPAGKDFLPVLFIIGAWGRKYRCVDNQVQFLDAENKTEIQAVAIDKVTGAPIGSRPINIVYPDNHKSD